MTGLSPDASDLELAHALGILPGNAPAQSSEPADPFAEIDTLTDKREQFRRLLELRRSINKSRGEFVEECKRAYTDEIETLWRTHSVKGKKKARGTFNLTLVETHADYAPLCSPIRERYITKIKAHRDWCRSIDEQCIRRMTELSESLELIKAGPREYAVSSVDSYRTQGYGASKYARGVADLEALHCQHYNVTTRIHEASGRFIVYVELDELSVEILRMRPGLTLRDEVKACWRRCLSPRVYYPFLPHGYEEENGLTYQGTDIPNWSPPLEKAS